MDASNIDTLMRVAAFEGVGGRNEIHDHLTATELQPGFLFRGERIPLVNPQRGISSLNRCGSYYRLRQCFRNLAAGSGMMIRGTSIARYSRVRKRSTTPSWAKIQMLPIIDG